MKKYDVAVLGSGVSGMTCALLQARRGRRVVLLEQASHLAPLLTGFDRQGTHFETGVHYCASLGPGEPGARLFERLGLHIPVRPCAPEGYGEIRLIPTGRHFPMVYGRDRLIARFAEDFPEDVENVICFLDKMRNEAARSPFLNKEKNRETMKFAPWSSRTLKEELDAHFRSREVKAIFATPTLLHGVPPERVSFALHSHIMDGMYDAIWEIEGGGRTLVAAYQEALERHGVEIRLRCQATRIELQGDTKLIHGADGFILAAAQCIGTLHAKAFLEIAPPELYRPSYRTRVMDIPETAGFLCLYAVCNGPAHRINTHFLLPELEFSHFPRDRSGSVYELHYSQSTPQTVTIVALVPESSQLTDRSDPLYSQRKEEAVRVHWERLSALCPDLIRNLTLVASATPTTQARYTGYSSGYGLMHDCFHNQVLPISKIPGIYLAGQSVVAPGVLGAMVSGFLSDSLIP